MNKNNNDNLVSARIKLAELREIKGFDNISDEKGEAFIDDAMTFARMLIQVINKNKKQNEFK